MMYAMRKAGVLAVLFVVVLLAVAVIAGAQQPPKVAKIDWLESGSTVRGSRLGELFVRRLRELGYVEGKNISFEYRSADDKLDRLPALAGRAADEVRADH
jgi:putative ABC transport system substrate-binding protein